MFSYCKYPVLLGARKKICFKMRLYWLGLCWLNCHRSLIAAADNIEICIRYTAVGLVLQHQVCNNSSHHHIAI